MSADTVDMQVSIRGGGFTSDPDYILFEGTTFLIPNPSAFPDGLQLLQGSNRIEVKSILTNGESTAVGIVEANLSRDRDVKATVVPPTGLYAERLDQTVRLYVVGSDDANVTGYNFYASISPGGGVSGYKRINLQPAISYTTEEQLSQIGTLTVDSTVVTTPDGSPVVDPLFFRVLGAQTDQSGEEVQQDFNEILQIDDTVQRFRTTTTIEAVTVDRRYFFVHDRKSLPTSSVNPAIPYGEFTAIPDTDPLYYAATAIYFIDGVEYESALSQEVATSPLIVTPAVSNLPVVSRQQIVRDSTLTIYRTHPEVDVKPGSYLRDTVIDPFATEAERIRFIIGFFQDAQSFTTLLAIDDPTGSKISVPVTQSPYKLALKQAFFLQDNQSVQNLIDNAFDHLASRRGVRRNGGFRARGEVVFYVTQRPSSVIYIPIGTILSSGGTRFRTTSAARITPSGTGTSYDPTTGRWSARAYIEALDLGSAGVVTRDQIRQIVNGIAGVQVTNPGDTYGGRNAESNYELAIRADGVLAGVDSGTYRGYTDRAKISGVQQVNVVDAGHILMMRDLDESTGRHLGGKVDVWVRGQSLATISDTFAFSFESVINGQFEPVGAIEDLKFRVVNANVSDENPLIEMLDNAAWGYEFTASGDGVTHVLSLQDVTVVPPDGIQLSTTHNDPELLRLTDVFRGSYRYRTSNKHVFTRQPVTEIKSFYRVLDDGVTQEIVSPSAYKLFHPSDPLVLGRSTEAGDYFQVVEPTDGSTPENIPTGYPQVVTGEEHILLTGPEYLNNLGANKYTLHVYNYDRTIEYYGPFHPSTPKDFTFTDEVGERPLAFVPVSGGRLLEGMRVLVDYQHDENYVVTYTTNSIVQSVQNTVDLTRHATANVVAKEAIPVGVNLTGTIVLQKNAVESTVEGLIRTTLGRVFGALSLGQPLRQGDVIDALESVPGVSYAVIPLTKMARQDGAIVVREETVTTEIGTDWVALSSDPLHPWHTDAVTIYLLKNPLVSGTENGGGDYNDFRGVFFNDIPQTLYPVIPNADGAPLKGVAHSACIIGNNGMSIPGYTGETARRVLLALPERVTPSDGRVTVTYIVSNDTGTKNISPGPTEYLVLGDLEFVYDADVDFTALVSGRRG
jgi:hypothetical protein